MLDWTHEFCSAPGCTGDTDCKAFPTTLDRIAMATAAFEEWAESDGTSLLDFIQDVCLLALSRGIEPATIRKLLSDSRRHYQKY